MNLESRVNASRSAHAFLERMSAIAKGWSVASIDCDSAVGEKLFTYCTDFATGHSWLSAVNYERFCTRANMVRSSNGWADIHNELDACIDLLVSQQTYWSASPGDECVKPHAPDSLFGLNATVMAFAGTTQVAFDDDLMQPGGHFIVLRYSNEFEGSIFRSMVVPPHLNDSDGVLTVTQFGEIVAVMVDRDQKDHPEWFK